MRARPVLMLAVIAVLAAACGGEARPPIRTDTAPLTRRVELPELAVARWRMTTLPDSEGRMSIGPIDVDYLWVYVELAPGAIAPPEGPIASIELPASVLDILPPGSRRSPVTGSTVTLRARRPNARVIAVRLGSGLVLQIEEDRGPIDETGSLDAG